METVKLLVEKGAKLDKLHNDSNFNASGSALMKAVRANQAETVELLLRLGADIDLIRRSPPNNGKLRYQTDGKVQVIQ